MVLKCELNTTSENRSKLFSIRKPPNILDEWNGYPESFSLFSSFRIFKVIFFPSNSYFTEKKSLGAPDAAPSYKNSKAL